jgi:Flp pilus assembly protein TadD
MDKMAYNHTNPTIKNVLGSVPGNTIPVFPNQRDTQLMEAPSDALADAIRLHQAGRLAEAEAMYRRVLERAPNHPGALHLLGVLAHQQGHDDRAAELIALAMELKPHQATYHSNYGVALRGLGRLDEAADALRQALRLWPEYPDAHSNLGLVFQQQDHLALARACFEGHGVRPS